MSDITTIEVRYDPDAYNRCLLWYYCTIVPSVQLWVSMQAKPQNLVGHRQKDQGTEKSIIRHQKGKF